MPAESREIFVTVKNVVCHIDSEILVLCDSDIPPLAVQSI